MLKKIGNYYLGIIKKFGVVIPSVIVGVSFLCMLFIDLFNGLRAIQLAAPAVFVVIAILAIGAFIAGAVYTVLKLKSKSLGIQDLGLACVAAAGVLCLIMFIFTGGLVGIGLWKWIITLIGLAIDLALSVLRVRNLD